METARLIVEEKEFKLQKIDFPDDSYVHLSPEDLARHYREQAEIKPIFRRIDAEALLRDPSQPPAVED